MHGRKKYDRETKMITFYAKNIYFFISKIFFKLFIVTFFSFIVFCAECEDYEYIMNSHYSLDSNMFNFTDGTAYAAFGMKGSWTDNYGHFGSTNCGGQFHLNKKKQVKIYGVCEIKDANENRRWLTLERDFGTEEVGAGNSKQIDSDQYWKFLNNTICKYGIEHGAEYSYSITKCKIDKKKHEILSRTRQLVKIKTEIFYNIKCENEVFNAPSLTLPKNFRTKKRYQLEKYIFFNNLSFFFKIV